MWIWINHISFRFYLHLVYIYKQLMQLLVLTKDMRNVFRNLKLYGLTVFYRSFVTASLLNILTIHFVINTNYIHLIGSQPQHWEVTVWHLKPNYVLISSIKLIYFLVYFIYLKDSSMIFASKVGFPLYFFIHVFYTSSVCFSFAEYKFR